MITSALPKYNVSPLHITFSHKAKNITYIDKLLRIRKARYVLRLQSVASYIFFLE